MSLLIGRYEFEGPLLNRLGVMSQPGIFAIMSYAYQEYQLVEVAEASDLQAVLADEGRQEYWQSKCLGMLTFSVHYCPRANQLRRLEMVGEIMREFDGDWRSCQPCRLGRLVASGSR